MVNICAFSHILRRPSSYITLHPISISLYMRKISFSFLSVQLKKVYRTGQQEKEIAGNRGITVQYIKARNVHHTQNFLIKSEKEMTEKGQPRNR
jgi:hypothetical protein